MVPSSWSLTGVSKLSDWSTGVSLDLTGHRRPVLRALSATGSCDVQLRGAPAGFWVGHRFGRVADRLSDPAHPARRPAGRNIRHGRLHQAKRGGARELHGTARPERSSLAAISALAARYRDRQ